MNTTEGLTKTQLEHLEREGYVVIPDVLKPSECNELSNAMSAAWTEHGLERQSSDMPGVHFINNALR